MGRGIRRYRLEWQRTARTVRRLAPYLRRTAPLFAGAFLSMMAFSLLQLLRPWPLKIVIDLVLGKPGNSAGGRWTMLQDLSPLTLIALASLSILAIAGLAALANYGQGYLGAKGGQLLAYRVRRDLYRHIHRLSLAFHDKTRSGDLVLRLTGDMNLFRNQLVPAALTFLSQMMVLIGIVVMMALIDPLLTTAALAILPLLTLASFHYSGRIRTAVRKQRRREALVTATAAESVASIPLVKIHGAEEFEAERFQSNNRRSFRQGLRATRLQIALERRVDLMMALGSCLVLWIGARSVLNGGMTAGDLVLAVSYMNTLYRPIRKSASLVSRVSKGLVAADRIWKVLETEEEALHEPGSRRLERVLGRISFEGVWFGYHPQRPVLHGIDLHIAPGETVALVGASGAGKSTLVRLLPRLYDPDRGTVRLDGVPLREVELASLRDQISFVTQETILLGISVRDNLAYGRPDATQEQVEAAARRARIHDRILSLPCGYDTILSERGQSLSGGERRRLALARAFLRESQILVLDEPDTFLDPVARAGIWEAAREMTEGRTAIFIIHDLSQAIHTDRIVVLENGRIVGEGRHGELVAACPAYRELQEASSGGREAHRATA